MARNKALICIRDYFLQSSDFNGILASNLATQLGSSWTALKKQLVSLISKQEITLAFASNSGNPHIKRIADLSIEDQIARVRTEPPETICAYPTASVIRQAVDVFVYNDRPFTQRLLLVEPHLTPVFFDLDVLDKYYRDPRYHFDFQDFKGSIGITTENGDSLFPMMSRCLFGNVMVVAVSNAEVKKIWSLTISFLSRREAATPLAIFNSFAKNAIGQKVLTCFDPRSTAFALSLSAEFEDTCGLL